MNNEQSTAAELIFSTFVFLCAEDKVVPIAAGKRLGELMGKPGWSQSAMMRRSLPALRFAYTDYWAAYQSEQEMTAATVQAAWSKVSEAVSPQDAASFARDLAMLAGAVGDPQNEFGATRRSEFLVIEQKVAAAQAIRRDQTPELGPGSTTEDRHARWWTGGEIQLQCVAVDDEAPDVKTFHFRALSGQLFRYDAGQAIQLHIEIDGKLVRRSYTISSSPSRPDRLAVTVKRMNGGIVSNWLHERMIVGQELKVSGPHGNLTCSRIDPAKLLLVSAGSGVTPMMSILRYLHDVRTPTDVIFLNNVRTPNDVIFAAELKALSATMGRSLTLAIVPAERIPGVSWNGPVGYFGEALLRSLAPDCIEREVFCCGPDGYRDLVRQALLAIGHLPERYHEERFGVPRPSASIENVSVDTAQGLSKAEVAHTARPHANQSVTKRQAVRQETLQKPKSPNIVSGTSPVSCQVSFEVSAKVINCRAGDLLLDVAEQNGIALDSSCRVGVCGTCRIKTSGGGIVMDERGALSESEIAQGYVLACNARVMKHAVVQA